MGVSGFFFLLLLLTLISLCHNFHVCARYILAVEPKSSYLSSSFSPPPSPPLPPFPTLPPAPANADQQLPLRISKSDVVPGTYVVSVGLGTPAKYLNLMLDTGSTITWVQCGDGCIYDPFSSNTSTSCQVESCTFKLRYLDDGFSIGYKVTDNLAISNYQFPTIDFGCIKILDEKSAKLDGILALGLSTAKKSVPPLLYQTKETYQATFCYCLPTDAANSGYLWFGSQAIQTCRDRTTPTRLVRNTDNEAMYFVNLIGITIGDSVISSSAAAVAIDSGTEISRLSPEVYEGVKAEFKKWMANYKEAGKSDILDTCYELGAVEIRDLEVPSMVLHFGDGLDVVLDQGWVFWPDENRKGVACLGFAASNVSIIGTHQLKGWNLLYDNEDNTVAFGSGSC